MNQFRVKIHLVTGESVTSEWGPTTEEEFEAAKAAFTEVLSGSGGWQLNLQVRRRYMIFPKHAVLYVEFETR